MNRGAVTQHYRGFATRLLCTSTAADIYYHQPSKITTTVGKQICRIIRCDMRQPRCAPATDVEVRKEPALGVPEPGQSVADVVVAASLRCGHGRRRTGGPRVWTWAELCGDCRCAASTLCGDRGYGSPGRGEGLGEDPNTHQRTEYPVRREAYVAFTMYPRLPLAPATKPTYRLCGAPSVYESAHVSYAQRTRPSALRSSNVCSGDPSTAMLICPLDCVTTPYSAMEPARAFSVRRRQQDCWAHR